MKGATCRQSCRFTAPFAKVKKLLLGEVHEVYGPLIACWELSLKAAHCAKPYQALGSTMKARRPFRTWCSFLRAQDHLEFSTSEKETQLLQLCSHGAGFVQQCLLVCECCSAKLCGSFIPIPGSRIAIESSTDFSHGPSADLSRNIRANLMLSFQI